MFCAGCGNDLKGMDGEFCAKCGKRVEGQELQAEASAEVQVQTQASTAGVLAKKKVKPWMIVAAVVVVAAVVFTIISLSGGELNGRWESEPLFGMQTAYVFRGNTFFEYFTMRGDDPLARIHEGTFSISDGQIEFTARQIAVSDGNMQRIPDEEIRTISFPFFRIDDNTFMMGSIEFTRVR